MFRVWNTSPILNHHLGMVAMQFARHDVAPTKSVWKNQNPLTQTEKKHRFCWVWAKKKWIWLRKKMPRMFAKNESCVTTPFPRCQFKRSRVFPRQLMKGNNMDSGEQKFMLKVANHFWESNHIPTDLKISHKPPNHFLFHQDETSSSWTSHDPKNSNSSQVTWLECWESPQIHPWKSHLHLTKGLMGFVWLSKKKAIHICIYNIYTYVYLGITGIQCRYDLKKKIHVFGRISGKLLDFWWFLLDSDMLIIFSNEFDRTNRKLKFDWQSLFRLKKNTINNS